MNSLYLDAATCKPTSRPPIWMMRQAGRYLPEYRALRQQHGFMQMMKTPELATEITVQPIRRFGMDAAILFCDILVTAEALGSQLHFDEGIGPVIDNPIRTAEDLLLMHQPDVEDVIGYVAKAIHMIKKELASTGTPLIGFCGAPFTVASYMIEGRGSVDLKKVKTIIGNQPEVLMALLDKLTDVSITYLTMQAKAGVNALQIFDTWAGLLSYRDFETFALPPIKRMIAALKPLGLPISVYCRHSGTFAPLLATTGASVISLDWQCNLADMRVLIPETIGLQGNLDPYLLLASEPVLKQRVIEILESMRGKPGFIFNLGHGVFPEVNPERVRLVVETVREWK